MSGSIIRHHGVKQIAGQVKIYGDAEVTLTLNGLELMSDKSAAINVQNESILYVHTHDGTENIICDAAKRSEESYYPEGVVADDEKRNGAIYCNGSVVFSGSGSLQITGKKKHGISVKSSVTFRPGVTVVINDVDNNVDNNCVKADGITILGAIYGQRRLQKQENASVLMLTSPYRAARSNFTHQAMLSTKRMRTTHLLPPA